MKRNDKIRIIVIDDNEIYNRLLSRNLRNHIASFSKSYPMELLSYTNAQQAINDLHKDTDLALVDYYLGDTVTALELLDAIKSRSPHCLIAILSQTRTARTSFVPLLEGASEFIYKDELAFAKTCRLAEEIIQSRKKLSGKNNLH